MKPAKVEPTSRCSAQVSDRDPRWPHYCQCSRSGVLIEDGKPWCQQHAPSTQKAKGDARDGKWEQQRREAKRKDALADLDREIVRYVMGDANTFDRALCDLIAQRRKLMETDQ